MRVLSQEHEKLTHSYTTEKRSLPFQLLPGDPYGGMGPRESLTSSNPKLPRNPHGPPSNP